MKVEIVLHGCDDSTYIDLEVNESELKFLERLQELSKKSSTYGCMPTLTVEKMGD